MEVVALSSIGYEFDISKTKGRFSSASFANWFFRYDSQTIEVRGVRDCKSRLIARVTVDDFTEFSNLLYDEKFDFCHVTTAQVNSKEVLLLALSNRSNNSTSAIFLYNPLTGDKNIIPLPPTCGKVTQLSFKQQRLNGATQSGQEFVHLLFVGTDSSKVLMLRLKSCENLWSDLYVNEEDFVEIFDFQNGKISAFGSCQVPVPSSQASYENIIAAASDGGNLEIYSVTEIGEEISRQFIDFPHFDHDGILTTITLFFNIKNDCYCLLEFSDLGNSSIVLLIKEANALGFRLLEENTSCQGLLQDIAIIEDYDKFFLFTVFSIEAQLNFTIFIIDELGRVQKLHQRDLQEEIGFGFLALHPIKGSLGCWFLSLENLAVLNSYDVEQNLSKTQNKESFYAKWCLVDDYDPTTISKILENRRMDDVLFIDRVFSFSGQDLNEIYPSGKLSNLIEQIVKSPILDELKINCLVYYLLKGLSDGTRLASLFASEAGLHTSYQKLMDAYWFLDFHLFDQAMELLLTPGIKPDWESAIVESMCRHGHYSEALNYYKLARPNVENPMLFMNMLLNSDLSDAFFYQRLHAKDNESFLRVLLDHVFKDQDKALIQQLLYLPFNATEENTLVNYCLQNDKPATTDFLFLYLLRRHRYKEVLILNSSLEQREGGATTEQHSITRKTLVQSIEKSLPKIVQVTATATIDFNFQRTSHNLLQGSDNIAAQMVEVPTFMEIIKPLSSTKVEFEENSQLGQEESSKGLVKAMQEQLLSQEINDTMMFSSRSLETPVRGKNNSILLETSLEKSPFANNDVSSIILNASPCPTVVQQDSRLSEFTFEESMKSVRKSMTGNEFASVAKHNDALVAENLKDEEMAIEQEEDIASQDMKMPDAMEEEKLDEMPQEETIFSQAQTTHLLPGAFPSEEPKASRYNLRHSNRLSNAGPSRPKDAESVSSTQPSEDESKQQQLVKPSTRKRNKSQSRRMLDGDDDDAAATAETERKDEEVDGVKMSKRQSSNNNPKPNRGRSKKGSKGR